MGDLSMIILAFYYCWGDRPFLNLTKMDELRYVESIAFISFINGKFINDNFSILLLLRR